MISDLLIAAGRALVHGALNWRAATPARRPTRRRAQRQPLRIVRTEPRYAGRGECPDYRTVQPLFRTATGMSCRGCIREEAESHG